ncbi:MAG: hypothetical protein N2487_05870, partial [Verrucomicrobiae bacterium]|nr:hypothetical protein [Verrucomicrobiae bacterium]
RWDSMMGVFLSTNMKYIVQWELFCNEIKADAKNVSIPVKDNTLMRGFWLIKPDNSLSVAGHYFYNLWTRGAT